MVDGDIAHWKRTTSSLLSSLDQLIKPLTISPRNRQRLKKIGLIPRSFSSANLSSSFRMQNILPFPPFFFLDHEYTELSFILSRLARARMFDSERRVARIRRDDCFYIAFFSGNFAINSWARSESIPGNNPSTSHRPVRLCTLRKTGKQGDYQ